MPSNLLNHTIPNLAAGVSQQFTESRFETQVEAMVNCMPSLARGIVRRNPLTNKKQLADLLSIAGYFTYSYDRGTSDEQYLIVIGRSQDWYVYNLNTGTQVDKGTDAYLTVPVGQDPKDVFRMITIGDHSYLINKTITTEMDSTVANPNGVAGSNYNKAFYWIKKTAGVVVAASSTVDGSGNTQSGNRLEGYKYTLRGVTVQGLDESRPDQTAVDRITTYDIATQLAADLNTAEVTTDYVADGAFVYNLNTTSSTSWDWEDSFGNEASLGVHGKIDSADKLPADLPTALGNVLVQVTGYSEGEEDDYWLLYNQTTKSWEETVEPGIDVQLKYSTMPHVFYRLADGSFVFDTYKEVAADGLSLTSTSMWADREVGNLTTSPDPSFIGKPITNLFFHRNRLGFITGDSVVLSGTNDYGTFFPTTVQIIPDDDVIDLTVATTTVTVLRHAVSTAGELVLFSDDAQFVLSAGLAEVLTPSSALIKTVSNYKYSGSADAKAIGNKIYFISESGGYSQIFKYQITEGLRATQAIPMTAHLPSFIPPSLKDIVGHSVLGYNFFWSSDSNKNRVYVLTNTNTGAEDIQNAFHTWEFSQNIAGMHIINNTVFFLFEDGSLSNIDLEIPGDITSVSYLDNGTDSFESKVTFSKYHIKDNNGNGTNRGRLQLRTLLYTITPTSKYMTRIYNDAYTTQVDTTSTWLLRAAIWDDTLVWDDTAIWIDSLPFYTREYYNDSKVTITSEAKNTTIEFLSNPNEAASGFELATINMEAFHHQRSGRY